MDRLIIIIRGTIQKIKFGTLDNQCFPHSYFSSRLSLWLVSLWICLRVLFSHRSSICNLLLVLPHRWIRCESLAVGLYVSDFAGKRNRERP